jgi:UDP-glucose 4-epimerase
MGTYVVTGGTGFVGQALSAQLRESGHHVIIASRATHHHDRSGDWIEFDLRDWATANNITNIRPDGVFHLAWSTTPATAQKAPASDASTNLAGTVNLLDQLAAAGGDMRVVLISSGGAVYGEAGPCPISEEQPPNPISIYGTTKLAMELYARRYRLSSQLDVRIARISNPFGAEQPAAKMQGAATIFARKIMKGEQIQIWGDGQIVRDYIDVADVASGLMAVMGIEPARCETSPVFNIGSGQGLSLVALIRHLEDAAGKKADVIFKAGRSFDVPVNVLDIARMRRETSWAPRKVDERLRALVMSLHAEARDPA